MKQITFKNVGVTKFGHPKSDYKKDGTLKKNRQEPREYTVYETQTINCKEIIVNGKIIGYSRKANNYIHRYPQNWTGTLFSENGKVVHCAFTACTSNIYHLWGFEMYKDKSQKWVIDEPTDYSGRYFALWLCDDNDEPWLIIKENYEYAKNIYSHYKYVEQYPWHWSTEYYFTPQEGWKTIEDFEKEFEQKYSNSLIDLECKRCYEV